MLLFCRNPYCSWTSMFAFLCGITCCTGNTISWKLFNKLSAWFSCSHSLFYLVNPAEISM